MLGFGQSAKVIDFNDGRGMRIRHIARFCDELGIDSAHFVGNSMGAINLLVDATFGFPGVTDAHLGGHLRWRGNSAQPAHGGALRSTTTYLPAMRRIVEALFHDPSYPSDDDYVRRRYESSTDARCLGYLGRGPFPPARSCAAADARQVNGPTSGSRLPTLDGRGRVRQASSAAAGPKQIADQIPGARWAVVEAAGHCPQIEQAASGQPAAVNLPHCGTGRLPPATARYDHSEFRCASQVISRPSAIRTNRNTISRRAAS